MHVGRGISIREERGTTLVELLVAITAGVVVLAAISAVAIAAMRQTARISTQVEATQRARQVMGQVVEELHSACLAPEIAPVRENSSGTELRFLHQIGSAVAPTPILSKISLSGGTLTQIQLRRHWRLGTPLDLQRSDADFNRNADDKNQPHRPEHFDF